MTPDLTEYDIIVAGSGIRMGNVYKPFKKFLDDNVETLMTKRVAFFICNVQTAKYMKFTDGIPALLRAHSFRISAFGGKRPLGGKKNKSGWMLTDEIESFIKAVKEKT
jgi:menaquinone-dependent protoporphyrinogen oxidase